MINTMKALTIVCAVLATFSLLFGIDSASAVLFGLALVTRFIGEGYGERQ